MSRSVMPPAYRLMIISSRPPRRRDPFGTSCGVKLPWRSRGTASSTSPISLEIIFGVVPLRELANSDASGVAALVADVVGQLHFQATLQGSFQHAFQQAVIPAQRHLAGVDLLKNLIQRTRSLQPISQLPLSCAPLSALRVVHRGHRGSSVLSN